MFLGHRTGEGSGSLPLLPSWLRVISEVKVSTFQVPDWDAEQLVLEGGMVPDYVNLFPPMFYRSFHVYGAGMKEGLSNSRPPLLEGMNYLIWKTKMRSFLCSLDDDVWFSVLEGYKIPTEGTEEGSIPKPRSKWTSQEKRDSNMNSKALNALFCGVDDLNFRYIQNCKIAKEAWDKLEVAHEGTEGVKRSKLQMLTSQFESIRMEEDEKVADFNAKLIDITNRSCLLGEEYIESKIVRKILRSLPHRFQGKVIAIEESKDVDKIRLEELIGSLETFEMGLGEDKKEKNKIIAFKSENNIENNEALDNEELVFFTRKFKQFLNKNKFSKNQSKPLDKLRNNKSSEKFKKNVNQIECFTCGGKCHISRDCANNKGKSMKVTWSDDSDEESEEGENEEENIQAFAAKLEEFEEESIEEDDNYEESLEHSYQELFEQGLELIKEKKWLKGKIVILENSNNNLINVAGNRKEEKQKLSSETITLQQQLDGAYKELEEKIHELAIEKAEKHELKEKLKEAQHAVSVLTLEAKKVTKMINFGKINDDKKGLGFDEDKVYSNSSTIFVKATSSPLNSEINSQTKIFHSKESNKTPKVVSQPSVSKNLHLKKNLLKNPQVKTRVQTRYTHQPSHNFQQPNKFFQNQSYRQKFNSTEHRVNTYQQYNNFEYNRQQVRFSYQPSRTMYNSFQPIKNNYYHSQFKKVPKQVNQNLPIRSVHRKPNERPLPKRFIPLSHQSKLVKSHNATNYKLRTSVLTNQGINKSFANQVGNKMNLQYLRKDRVKNQVEKALCVADSIDKSDWYFDSGCTKHMTGDIRNFYSLDNFGTGTIVYGNGEISNILRVGQADITGLPTMDKVCYVDKLTVNLISIGQLCDSGFKVLFDEYYCNIYDSNKKIVGQGYRTACGLYRAKIIEFDMCTNESLSDIDESEDDCDVVKGDESQEWNEANEQ
ncbi:hypothetical protein UlMin_027766 [Ulmus minor]